MTKFDGCLQAAQEQFAARGKPTEGAVEACVQRWSPEHQKPLPAGSAPADDPRAKAASPERVARSQGDEEIRKSVAPSPESSGKAADDCRAQLKEQQAAARTAAETRDTASRRLKQCDTVTADLGKEVDRWRLAARRQGDLQGQLEQVRGELQAAAARPGLAEFAAFPAGPASGEIALLGAGAVAVGWVFGLLGRATRRAKLLSGAVSAGLSLLVYLGAVALLPDTRLPHLLLALTAAVLFAALRTLGRAYVLLRQQRQTP